MERVIEVIPRQERRVDLSVFDVVCLSHLLQSAEILKSVLEAIL